MVAKTPYHPHLVMRWTFNAPPQYSQVSVCPRCAIDVICSGAMSQRQRLFRRLFRDITTYRKSMQFPPAKETDSGMDKKRQQSDAP